MSFIPLERRGGAPVEYYRFQFIGTSTALARWTSSDIAREISIAGAVHPTGGDILETYLPAAIARERIDASDERSGTGLRVLLPADSGETNPLVDLFRGSEPPTPVEMCLYRGHRGSTDVRRIYFGDVTDASFADGHCLLNIEPKHGALTRTVNRQLYQTPCNNMLYDGFCGVNKAAFAAAATVTAISTDGLTLTVAEAALQPDGYYAAAGLLEFGTRIGMIDAHTGDQLTLVRAVPGLIAGSAVTIYPGCKRDLGDCDTKFNNAANHMGFPFIPSVDPFTAGVQTTSA